MGQSTWGVTFFSETLSGAFLSYSLVKLNKMASTSSTVIFVIVSACSLMRATAITDLNQDTKLFQIFGNLDTGTLPMPTRSPKPPTSTGRAKDWNRQHWIAGLLPLPKSGLTTWRAVASSTTDHWTRGRRMPELRTLLAAASLTLKAVTLSWAGRTPLATTKICLEITKSWGWVLPRNEAASSSVRLLGTRMSRRQRLLLQCMESHSLTLQVPEWIPLRLL